MRAKLFNLKAYLFDGVKDFREFYQPKRLCEKS